MAEERMGMEDRKLKDKTEIPTETIVLRNFGGVNQETPRVGIGDEEFSWLENIMPITHGNLSVLPGPQTTSYAPSGTISYVYHANWGNVDYDVVFFVDGSAEAVNKTTYAKTPIAGAGTFTNATIAPWNNQGIVIVDAANGYFDFNITTANTLSVLSNSITSITNIKAVQGIGSQSPDQTAVITSTGTGAQVISVYTLINPTIIGGGTGYAVNDVITFTDGNFLNGVVNNQAQIRVTSIGGGGVVTGFVVLNAGLYSSGANVVVQIGPAGNATTTTGGGTLVSIQWTLQWKQYNILAAGHGYAPGDVVSTFRNIPSYFEIDRGTITLSGSLNGSSVAAFAGRVWIASGKVVSFTDVNSYNSFGGAGGSFTITDDWLNGSITALFAANNFLYIFGQDSIDVVSNVQVNSLGLTTFSRSNLTASVGTTIPKSIFAYLRSVYFASASGFYALSGATPQKVSDSIDGVVNNINLSLPIYGGQVLVRGKLCPSFAFTFYDANGGLTPSTRSILAIFNKGRWFFSSPTASPIQAMTSYSNNSVETLAVFTTNSMVLPFFNTYTPVNWLVRTKLWDGGDPMADKQPIRVSALSNWMVASNQMPIVTTLIDTEYKSLTTRPLLSYESMVQWINASNQLVNWTNVSNQVLQWGTGAQYSFLASDAYTAPGKHIGITMLGTQANLTMTQLALNYKKVKIW